jgi:HlyD family secretion protein
MTTQRRARRWLAVTGPLAAVAVAVACIVLAGEAPAIEAAEVTRGDYIDRIEIRGEIHPVRSTLVTAPRGAGSLVIIELVRDGTEVKAGDVVARFDAVTLRRRIQDLESQLRTALAQADQARAQANVRLREAEAAVIRASYDVERATLALGDVALVSEVEAARARLDLADAEQRLREAEALEAAAEASIAADQLTREQRIAKIEADIADSRRSATSLEIRAPVDGTVQIMQNSRSAMFGGPRREYRTGDETYAGATILELPDLSQVFLIAKVDEVDRGQVSVGQQADVRIDAVADRSYRATITDISLLAFADFLRSYPPAKEFDLRFAIEDPDARLRPGMTAVARIAVGRLPDVLLVPAAAVTVHEGRDVVYRVGRRALEPVPVEVLRRGRDQAAVAGAIEPGDRVSLTPPEAAAEEGSR